MNLGSTRQTQYVTFRIADLLLGIEVLKVQEVIRAVDMTVIPLAPASVQGLINLRGQIVLAIDARQSLGLPPASHAAPPMNIVIQSDENVVSLLVDEIHDVIDVPDAAYAPVPDNMPPERRSQLKCVYDLKIGLLLVLDTERIIENACHSALPFQGESLLPNAKPHSVPSRI